MSSPTMPAPEQAQACISVVIPVRNEAGNIAPVVAEIEAALTPEGAFEIIYVDDGSRDATAYEIVALAATRPHLRLVAHAQPCGQSAAVRTGVRAARAAVILTIDGDGQNDPRFMPAFLRALEAGGPACGLVQGLRVERKATLFKRVQSRVANAVRGLILRDGACDSGCGFRCFRREIYLALPYFDALHRFLPALVRREGFEVAQMRVDDRPRLCGVSNYGFFDRLWVGLVDLVGVCWLIGRCRRVPVVSEVTRR